MSLSETLARYDDAAANVRLLCAEPAPADDAVDDATEREHVAAMALLNAPADGPGDAAALLKVALARHLNSTRITLAEMEDPATARHPADALDAALFAKALLTLDRS